MLNKYAKQKKRRRNFSIDRRHHYEKILEEETERKGSGLLKKLFLIGALTGVVFLCIMIWHRMETQGKEFAEVTRDAHAEQPAGKDKGRKRRN